MARNIMAVCVVCLLCAEHLPCKEHFDTVSDKNNLMRKTNNNYRFFVYNTKIIDKNVNDVTVSHLNGETFDRIKRNIHDEDKHKHIDHNNSEDHDHDHNHNEEKENINEPKLNNYNSKIFVKKLFEKFGDGDKMLMNVIGFETMLKHLGLYKLVTEEINLNNDESNNNNKQTINSILNNNNENGNNETCVTSLDLITKMSPNSYELNNSYNDKLLIQNQTINNNNNSVTNNLTNENIKRNNKKETTFLNINNLWSICPILLYQLTGETSLERAGCINNSLLKLTNVNALGDHSVHSPNVYENVHEDRQLVWLYSSLSILGVSLCGLLGVAVIPCMDKYYYQHILQFLVALAVGTLCGDALLHLLPHAMMPQHSHHNDHHSNGDHDSMIFKGLVAVLGIIFFFITERGLTVIAEWRKKQQKKDKPPSRVRVMRDPESVSLNNSTGEKLCKHKYSSYPYCYDEIAMDTKDDHHHHSNVTKAQTHSNNTQVDKSNCIIKNNTVVVQPISNLPQIRNNDHDHGDHNDTAQSLLVHKNFSLPDHCTSSVQHGPHHHHHHHHHHLDSHNNVLHNNKDANQQCDNNIISNTIDEDSIENRLKPQKNLVHEENYTIILREHESKHHGHSHTHGHVHSPPSSLSAVAWMVVMGDGLHNFTDGMAIGAAFSNNIAGGFSTAVAVFCHELPHELGDFAVLLKAGMSARQAVTYNLLSSVLSFFGMVIGVLIGDTPEASSWIFACAAGLFIYIALVDMMPELTSSHKEGAGALSQCLLQLIGMCLGLLTMYLIAIYEHKLKKIFTADNIDENHYHYSSNNGIHSVLHNHDQYNS